MIDSTLPTTERGIRLEWLEASIARVRLDQPGKSANVMTQGMLDDLEFVLDELATHADLRGIILVSAKPRIFVAGADLVAIAKNLDWTDDEIQSFCARGQQLFDRLRHAQAVSVAVIDGACLGGGLELALACDYRIATDEPRTILGLPEVKLGLIPGWAGTARLPRLIGLAPAAELLTSGRTLSAAEAHSRGLVDRLVASDSALAEALALVAQAWGSSELATRRQIQRGPIQADAESIRAIGDQVQSEIAARSELHDHAPLVVWRQLADSALLAFPDACRLEARAMCQVWGSPSCRGLLNLYFLAEHNKKNPGRVDLQLPPRPVQRVGIVGLGVMGRAIAHAVSSRSLEIVAWDEREEARGEWRESFNRARAVVAESLDDLAPCDLVIEAIAEDVESKRRLLAALADVLKPSAVIASNTSTIPMRHLHDGRWDASRLVGIHFCHPQLMSLVEVVRSDLVSEDVVTTAVQWVRSLGKSPVVVADSPGFVVNRLLAAMFDVALEALHLGADYVRVDESLKSFGFRAGPFEIMDLIGIDTVVLAGRSLVSTGAMALTTSPILPRLLRKSRRGRKSKAGFYRYDDPAGSAMDDPITRQVISPYQRAVSLRADEPLAEHMAAAMLIQACQLLDTQVVSHPRDIDWCVVQGLTFPSHRGGLLFWADQRGADVLQPAIEQILATRPGWVQGPSLQAWLQEKARFYSMI